MRGERVAYTGIRYDGHGYHLFVFAGVDAADAQHAAVQPLAILETAADELSDVGEDGPLGVYGFNSRSVTPDVGEDGPAVAETQGGARGEVRTCREEN